MPRTQEGSLAFVASSINGRSRTATLTRAGGGRRLAPTLLRQRPAPGRDQFSVLNFDGSTEKWEPTFPGGPGMPLKGKRSIRQIQAGKLFRIQTSAVHLTIATPCASYVWQLESKESTVTPP